MKTAFAASIRKLLFRIAVGIAFNAANVNAATDLPVQQWAALQCNAGQESESCCARWCETVVDAARASSDASSMLALLLRKIERWTKVEKRSQCAIKHDIEARATELAPTRSSINAVATAKTNSAAR